MARSVVTILATVLVACIARAENLLFRELTVEGIQVASQAHAKLPLPTLVEGMDAPTQLAAIERLSETVPRDEFLRPSPVAPYILKMESVNAEGQREAQRVSLWFVAFGQLQTVRDEKLLKELAGTAAGKNRSTAPSAEKLTMMELKERTLVEGQEDGLEESFVRFQTSLLDRVQVSGVLNVVQTAAPGSILVCSALDPRFAADARFPNQWRPIEPGSSGNVQLGSVRPYAGFGGYVKATVLSKPTGALFIEAHALFNEPTEWFGGANLLRSKLPLAIQDQVRSFRRKLSAAERGTPR